MDETCVNALKAFAYQADSNDKQPKVLLKLRGRTLTHVHADKLTIFDQILKFLSRFGIGSFSLSKIVKEINALPNNNENKTLQLAKVKLLAKVIKHNNKRFAIHVPTYQLDSAVQAIAQNVLAAKIKPDDLLKSEPSSETSSTEDITKSNSKLEPTEPKATIDEQIRAATTYEELDSLELTLVLINDTSYSEAFRMRRKELSMSHESSGLTELLEGTYHVTTKEELDSIIKVIKAEIAEMPLVDDPDIINQILILHDALLQKEDALNGITKTAPVDLTIGKGIVNGGNSCYLNACVQALKCVPLQEIYSDAEGVAKTRSKLHEIHQKLNHTTLSGDEINEFRNFMRINCRLDVSEYSQEDAHEACAVLLDALGVKLYNFSYYNEEVLRWVNDQANMAILPIDLINQDQSVDSLVKSIDFVDPPSILPIQLNRFSYLAGTQKKNTSVIPSQKIFVNTKDGDRQIQVEYELASIVVHEGASPRKGHYYTYVPQPDGAWIEFNDSLVTRHLPPPIEDTKHNGYLYFYRRIR